MRRSWVSTMMACSLGLRGATSPMARSIYVSVSTAVVPTGLASITTTHGNTPVCRLAWRTFRSKARTLAACRVLNSALTRFPGDRVSSASPPETLRPLSKTLMPNCSANVVAIATSAGRGALPGRIFTAMRTDPGVATATYSTLRGVEALSSHLCSSITRLYNHLWGKCNVHP
jgi:hypothetical protein